MLNAARIADKIGEPINIMLTVNLTLLGKTNPNVDDVAAALAERFRKWVTRPGKKANSAQPLKARYFWAAENPTHTNLHFAVHVPSGREIEFDKKARRWVEAIVGTIDVPEAFHIRLVDYAPGIAEYLCKGAQPAVARAYKLKRQEPQGWIVGTRSRTSRSLGPSVKKALREAGVYPHPSKLRVRPLPSQPTET